MDTQVWHLCAILARKGQPLSVVEAIGLSVATSWKDKPKLLLVRSSFSVLNFAAQVVHEVEHWPIRPCRTVLGQRS